MGATRLVSPSAAVLRGTASGWRTDGGLQPAPGREEFTVVLFGVRPDIVAWIAGSPAKPEAEFVARTRHL